VKDEENGTTNLGHLSNLERGDESRSPYFSYLASLAVKIFPSREFEPPRKRSSLRKSGKVPSDLRQVL